MTVAGIFTYDQSSGLGDILRRSRVSAAILDDYGQHYPPSAAPQLLDVAPDGALIMCRFNIVGSGSPMYRFDPAAPGSPTVYRITSDLNDAALGLGNTVYQIRFDNSGRLFLFTRKSSTEVGVIRLNADLTLDTTFTLTFTLSTDPLSDAAPTHNPSIPTGLIPEDASGIDLSGDGRYLYIIAEKGVNASGSTFYRNVYKFDLDASPSPTASLWKQFPFYAYIGAPPPDTIPSDGRNLQQMPCVLAVDPLNGKVAIGLAINAVTTEIVGADTYEWDNVSYYLRTYDSGGTQLSSTLVAQSEHAAVPFSSTYAGYYFANRHSNPMRWTPEGDAVYYWLYYREYSGSAYPEGMWLADGSGRIGDELYTGTTPDTTALVIERALYPGLSRFNAATAAQEYFVRT
jgi:hypothetical protein